MTRPFLTRRAGNYAHRLRAESEGGARASLAVRSAMSVLGACTTAVAIVIAVRSNVRAQPIPVGRDAMPTGATGAVTGTVRAKPGGFPIAGARVCVAGCQVTGPDGRFFFPSVPAGVVLYGSIQHCQTTLIQLILVSPGETRFYDILVPVPSPSCPADLNGDCVTGFADLTRLLAEYGRAGPQWTSDINHDGYVNFADLIALLVRYGERCGGLTNETLVAQECQESATDPEIAEKAP